MRWLRSIVPPVVIASMIGGLAMMTGGCTPATSGHRGPHTTRHHHHHCHELPTTKCHAHRHGPGHH